MFVVNDDLSIYATRGDIVFFNVTAEDNGKNYKFQVGDIVRIKVYGKKDAEEVVLQKDFPVTEITEKVEIYLSEEDTKIGEVISKPKDYWYEVELNPNDNPQTIIGYDEDGAKVFKLFPEGDDIPPLPDPKPEEIPIVDEELDFYSTRPVQNQAITRAFENLLDGYERTHAAVAELHVTPEMYGAIGDGEADDTEAIVSALETGSTVVLKKTYCVGTMTVPMGARVVVDGTLIVKGTINICYPNIHFSGNGRIKCAGTVCFTLKGAGKTNTTYCKNFYIGAELTVYGEENKDNTAFLITADNGTEGIVVYPEINCKIQTFKYGIHSLYSGNDGAWFTSLRCRSLIENCRYAIILDWHGTGSVYDGVIQPLVVSNPATDDIPLVKVGNNCTVRCMVWDMATAPNKYAVCAEGTYNTIDVPNYSKYVYCKEPDRNHVATMVNRHFDASTTFCQGIGTQPVLLPYDNTNDLAINAGNNKVGLTVTPSILAGAAKSLLSGTGAQSIQWYFDKSHAPNGAVLEFDFPVDVALRQIFVSGSKLPDSVMFEYKNTAGEWVHLKTCTHGVDFKNYNGQENYAWWQFVYSYADGFTFQKKFAKGVRITMNTETAVELTRIHIGAVNVTMPTKMGDDLVATSFKIKGSDGKFYDISVKNGTLVATAES